MVHRFSFRTTEPTNNFNAHGRITFISNAVQRKIPDVHKISFYNSLKVISINSQKPNFIGEETED